VTRIDRYDVRSGELFDAAVLILNVNLAAHEETNVRVHAQIGAGNRPHMRRPPEADG